MVRQSQHLLGVFLVYSVIYQMWSKEGQIVNWQQGHEHTKLSEAHGRQRIACLRHKILRFHAGYDRRGSEHMHRSLHADPIHCRNLEWAQK